jgi:cob(I)alamin adenosyltransferase
MSGYVHVYTGDGKGKTTAALGLVLRAAGAGWKAFFAQFAKGMETNELRALERFSDLVTVRQYGGAGFVIGEPEPSDIASAARGLAECQAALSSGEYPIVVLDEANVAVALKLFAVEDLIALIDSRPAGVELVITGRSAHPRVVERADLVTEMREVKHYYNHGVPAREGIDK